jgi:hypothetical protein
MALGIPEKCANYGCNREQATSSGKKGEYGARYRPVCSKCHEASYKGTRLPFGVTDFKKYKCSNINGHLGFPCATDHTKIVDKRGKFQIDHIDGDHTHNSHNNLQELCLNCHQEKSMRDKDYSKTNVTVKTMDGHVLFEAVKKIKINKPESFDTLFE